ncbi:hypothetical protein Tco_1164604, partial [Tanacetum coccineum]
MLASQGIVIGSKSTGANDPVFTDLSRLQQRLGEWEVYRFDESNKYKCGGWKVVLDEEQKPQDYIEELFVCSYEPINKASWDTFALLSTFKKVDIPAIFFLVEAAWEASNKFGSKELGSEKSCR